jgi:hypothetical protein
MSTYDESGSWVGRVVTYVVIALLLIAAIKLAFWVFGAALGLGFFLLFTVGPILLVGWIAVKLFRMLTRSNGYN